LVCPVSVLLCGMSGVGHRFTQTKREEVGGETILMSDKILNGKGVQESLTDYKPARLCFAGS
jgi:hypothetical protein